MKVKLSVELFEDMTDPSATGIENEIAQAIGLELDRVALYGTGTPPEPKVSPTSPVSRRRVRLRSGTR